MIMAMPTTNIALCQIKAIVLPTTLQALIQTWVYTSGMPQTLSHCDSSDGVTATATGPINRNGKTRMGMQALVVTLGVQARVHMS